MSLSTPADDDGEETPENFADGTPLVELLGDHPRPRILAVLVAHKSREFNVSELARHAGLARKTVYEHVEDLEALGAVDEREATQGTRYTLGEADIGQKVWELEGVTLQRITG